MDRVQSLFGSRQELAPVDYSEHRKNTDDLLAMLRQRSNLSSSATIPSDYYLAQNYPNPFNNITRIAYGLPQMVDVSVKIYDVMGREVVTLVRGRQEAGHYTAIWQGTNQYGRPAASGVYFCRIQAGDFVKVNKMTLLK